MYWKAIAEIVFICTAVNHLGLIGTIEGILKRELPVINCPRCFTFWSVLAYQLVTDCNPLFALAIAFLSSYMALWLNLFMYGISTLYNRIYDKIEDYDKESGAEPGS